MATSARGPPAGRLTAARASRATAWPTGHYALVPSDGKAEAVRLPIRCDRRITLYRLLGWTFGFVPLSLVLFWLRDDLVKGGLTYGLVVLAPIGLCCFLVGWLLATSAELSEEGVRECIDGVLIPWSDIRKVRARPFLGVIRVDDRYGRSITFPNQGKGVSRRAVLVLVLRMVPRGAERLVPPISFG